MLPCNVSFRNSVCNPDNPTLKYVRKSIYKSASTSSILPSKLICDSNVRSSKLVSGTNVCSVKPVSVSSICPSKQTCGSNVRY